MGDCGPSLPECCQNGPRRWKEAPLAQRLFIIHNMMMRIGDRLVADLGLTGSRWLLLGAVANRAEPPMLSELSADSLLSLQNVSRMVACMEEDGLLERFSKPGGGRAIFVRLTAKGCEVHGQTKERARRFASSFLKGVDEPSIERMERELERLITNLESLENVLCDEQHNARSGAPACDPRE